MKKLFLILSLALTFAATSTAQVTVPVKTGPTVPATCSTSNVQTRLFYKTGASAGLYYCSATNTWTQIASTGSPALVTPNLGTPSAVNLANGSSLPISTGVSGLGTGVATALGTPSSANIATAVTDETGSGSLVFSISPSLTTPNLGTPSAVNLANGTSLPVSGITASTSTALGVGSVELGHAMDTTLDRGSSGRLRVESVNVPTISSTDTFTNKRISKRVVTVTQSATPTINTDNTDVASITGLAQAITSMTTNLTGTPSDGDLLWVQITDNGTARAITWGASFEASGNQALPTTTVLSTRLDVLFAWNAVTSKWRCIAVA